MCLERAGRWLLKAFLGSVELELTSCQPLTQQQNKVLSSQNKKRDEKINILMSSDRAELREMQDKKKNFNIQILHTSALN